MPSWPSLMFCWYQAGKGHSQNLKMRIGAKDNKAVVIVTKKARVRDNGFPDIIEGTLASIHPYACNWISILVLDGRFPKRCDPEFKVVNVFAIKLSKADELRNITLYLRDGPCLK